MSNNITQEQINATVKKYDKKREDIESNIIVSLPEYTPEDQIALELYLKQIMKTKDVKKQMYASTYYEWCRQAYDNIMKENEENEENI